MSESETGDEDGFEGLLAEAEGALENVTDSLGDVESFEELDDDALESLLGDVDTLVQVAEETDELIEALDVTELPEAVDADELLEAIEIGELPDVLADDETGAGDLVDFTQLFKAIDLLDAWDATDLGDIWSEKRELEEAVDDLADDGDDASVVEEAASAVSDEDDSLIGGEDGVIGDDDELLEDMDATSAAKEALGKPDVEDDPEAYQMFIQQQAMKGIDAFREALLETNEKFEQLYEFNREKMRRQDTSTNSRNPTAAATIPTERRDLGGGARHSTVPQQVKLSTAPSRKRIYGRRFEIEREKRRDTND